MVRTRFSPSPTGMMHIGNARAALFSALFAMKEKGVFVLRIEDTDQVRSEHKYTQMLEEDLNWLGVYWQEGPEVGGPYQPYFQSQRSEVYNHYYQELEDKGLVYPCFCTDEMLAINRKIQLSRGQPPRYPETCLKLSQEEISKRIAQGAKPALRFRVPKNTQIEFVDLVKGLQKFNSDDIGDFIIRRAEGTASFMFSNAIDDSLMKITHAIRGDDHLANTPRQLMLLQALNVSAPQYAHLSLITGDDGSKLSKRNGSSSLNELHHEGYLSRAVLNYLSRLSHACDEKKLMTFAEIAEYFKIEKLSRAPARFDKNQLLHWQKEAVMALDIPQTQAWLGETILEKVPDSKRELFADMMRQNILFPKDAQTWVDVFFGKELVFNHEQLDILKEAGSDFFVAAEESTKKHGINIKNVCDDLKTTLNLSGKKLFMPLRIALTGQQNGPELAHITSLLGAERMLAYFQHVEKLVKEN